MGDIKRRLSHLVTFPASTDSPFPFLFSSRVRVSLLQRGGTVGDGGKSMKRGSQNTDCASLAPHHGRPPRPLNSRRPPGQLDRGAVDKKKEKGGKTKTKSPQVCLFSNWRKDGGMVWSPLGQLGDDGRGPPGQSQIVSTG